GSLLWGRSIRPREALVVFLGPATTRGGAADQAEIKQDCKNDHDHMKARHRTATVDRPRVGERRHWHDEKSNQRPQGRLVCTADVVAEDDDQDDRESRRRQRKAPDDKGHGASLLLMHSTLREQPPPKCHNNSLVIP